MLSVHDVYYTIVIIDVGFRLAIIYLCDTLQKEMAILNLLRSQLQANDIMSEFLFLLYS